MSAIAPIDCENHLIFMHPDYAGCLLLQSSQGWHLPVMHEGQRRLWQELGHLHAWLERQKIPATILRCVDLAYQPDRELVSKVYGVLLRDVAWVPPAGARWVTQAELDDLAFLHESHRALLHAWFRWYTGDPSALRPPWYQPDWYGQALAWANTSLTRLGLTPTGAPTQVRSWQRSAMLRFPTAEGEIYMKAVLPIFRHEPGLTAALAQQHPGYVAQPLTLDPVRGWMLMAELPGPKLATLREEDDLPHWEAALARLAELQLASVPRYAELRALGLPEYPLERLAARLEPLLADPAAALPDRPAGLSPSEWTALQHLATRVATLSTQLAAYDLPTALEHGDLWAGQVIVGPQGSSFLDWSASSLTHPFFSLLLFLVEIEDFFPRERGIRERLRDAYLEPWGAYARGAKLTQAFELAQPLAALHHALIYHRIVLPNLEIKWELELLLPFYLKMALRLQPDYTNYP
ncbi:phosphotransferase family protein [Candidatus Viridilinea mediisalina]|uniref:Aminoglycoside phosphotransferase domain-containing protein n=1 Tax=Candidatus Viridilinea mediisalina TaxID=2024553 RepID=A0A2A6RJ09_9CHLR|nr:hypothetical protein [Candidatus Viridilinea mediisalina]PDW03114.1 hypothetical protein CJ255_10380 [Candidatus Viridilinea mediisalina]